MKLSSLDPGCLRRLLLVVGCSLVEQEGGKKRGLDRMGNSSAPLGSFPEKLMVCLKFLSIVEGRRENSLVIFHRSLLVKEEVGYWRWNLIGQVQMERGSGEGQQNDSEFDYLDQ